MAASRKDAPALEVICLGLPRTGTTSIKAALEVLGFGPCHHMSTVMQAGGKEFAEWCKIGDGNRTPEAFDAILRGYRSVADYPAALYPEELYAAYPEAKYILTTRDPEKWKQSMENTIFRTIDRLSTFPERSELQEGLVNWHDKCMQGQKHHGRLRTHPREEMATHEELVKKVIPPEKLLVYQVGEGWERLVEFLEVAKPTEPFPHANDSAQFEQVIMAHLGVGSRSENVAV